MQEMLEYIVKNLISKPEEMEIEATQQRKTKVFKVKLNKKDLGNVIGKNGSIANAIRTVVRSTSNSKEKLVIKFEEN